jgi:hypothetical protein
MEVDLRSIDQTSDFLIVLTRGRSQHTVREKTAIS